MWNKVHHICDKFLRSKFVFRDIFRTLSNIKMDRLPKKVNGFLAVNYFCKKFHLRCLKKIWTRLCYLLYTILLASRSTYRTRHSNIISQIRVNHYFFQNSFFPSHINNETSLILIFVKLIVLLFLNQNVSNSSDLSHNRSGINLTTCLRLGLSYLHKHQVTIAFKIFSTPILTMAMVKLNQVLITFATVPFLWRK